MAEKYKISLADVQVDMQQPTLLYQHDGHAIYWLGITEQTVFRCNVYLILDSDEAILVDPGSRSYFEQVKSRVAQIIDPALVNGMILCHQDPDVAASMVDWLELCPDCMVYTSPRAQVLLPHFGVSGYRWQDIEKEPVHHFASGRNIHFITAPFLHSPAAFTSYDKTSHFLFSGDIWAALMTSWSLTVGDFEQHRMQMDIFHMDYMASNVAARGFINKLDELSIHAILPQHGAIIGSNHVAGALAYMRELQCGADIVYPDVKLSMEKGDHVDQLKQQIKLLEEALGQSDRIREQWHHANRQLAASRQALKRSEALHREIMINAFDAIIIADRTGLIVEANPAATGTFGYPQEVWSGLKITALIPEHLRRKHKHGFQSFIETGERNIIGQCVETEALHRDGHVFPIELTISALQRGQDKVMATIRDITTRKQADTLVRKLSSAIEQTGESILITDSDGIIEYVNPAFTRITGYSAEEAIGQTPRLLKSGNQDAAFYEAMWKTISDGKVWHGKVIDKRKDGSFYPAMLTISPIFNESGDAVYFVGTQSDLSNLENMEQQFYQAQKMEAVGTMVGGIAHNFNNMLAGMTGNLYLAKKGAQAQPDVVEKLANVEELSMHAAEMIAQLLAFARKGMISMKAMPLTPFINETLKLMRTSVPENIAVHQNMCADDLQITGDPTQLHQVLANLVNNACDAVEGVHEPCITIRLESFHTDEAFIESRPYFKPGAYAHLSVADNGMGIPEAQIAHLFEPFFTTKEQSKGTGLGLAMVYGAIKTHHGFIEVESTPGKGSTFHLYVPLLELKEMAAKPVQKQETAEGRGELILLADDEPMVREVMAEVLKSLGYRVLTAEDGVEAIEVFKAHRQAIALALLDVVMPHLGGMPLARKIREMEPDVPVIFLTGYDQGHVLAGDKQIDNSDILTKPVNFDALSHSIRQLLGE